MKLVLSLEALDALRRCSESAVREPRRTSRGFLVELDDQVFDRLSYFAVKYRLTVNETILLLADLYQHNPFERK